MNPYNSYALNVEPHILKEAYIAKRKRCVMKFNKLPRRNIQLFGAILLMLAFGLACFTPFVRQVKAAPLTLDGVTYDMTTHECVVTKVVDAEQLRQVFKQDLDPQQYIYLTKITFEPGSGISGNAKLLFAPSDQDEPTPSDELPNSWKSCLNNKTQTSNNGKTTSHLTEVTFPDSNFTFSSTTMDRMFQNCQVLTSLNLSAFDTSQVTDMRNAFFSCKILTDLKMSNFTSDSVLDTSCMFGYCEKLTSITMPNFSVTNRVTSINSMFENCYALQSINIKSWDTSNVTDMSGLFWLCQSLETYDFIKTFDTSNVSEMAAMFAGIHFLPDISGFNTAKVKDMSGFSMGASVLPDLSILDTSHVQRMHALIAGCTSLTEMPEWLTRLNTESVWDFSCMFAGLITIPSLVLPKLNMNHAKDIHGMFAGNWTSFAPLGSSTTKTIDISNIHTANAVDFGSLFEGLSNIEKIDASPLDTTNATSLNNMFDLCPKLTSIIFFKSPTSNVKDFTSMFEKDEALTTLNLDFMDTSSATTLEKMFSNCTQLSDLNLNGINTSQVTNMSGMFAYCTNLLDYNFLLQFDTENVTTFSSMFEGDYYVKNLDFSHFVTPNLVKTNKMFLNCQGLEELDLSTFTTDAMKAAFDPEITQCVGMFNNCGRLKTLNIAHFDLNGVFAGSNLFLNSPCLQTIITCGGFNQGYKFNACPEGDSWSIFDNNTGALLYGPGELTKDVFANFDENLPITISTTSPRLVWDSNTQTYYVKDVFNEEDLYEAWRYIGPLDTKHVVFEDGTGLTGRGLAPLCVGFSLLESVTFPADPNNFDAHNLSTLIAYFADCPRLVSLDMSSFETGDLTGLQNMFRNDTALRSVNLAGLHFSNTPNITDMFYNTPSLAYVALSSNFKNVSHAGYPEGNTWYAYNDVNESPYWGPGTITSASFEGATGSVVTFAKGGFGWQQDADGNWWYLEKDGSFSRNEWKWIEENGEGHWYRFNEQGNLITSSWLWDASEKSWYYCGETGAMLTGCWAWLDDAWYGFWWNGKMCKGWIWDADWQAWYYCYDSGAMTKGCWSWIDNDWYGFWWNGKMCQGWTWDSDWQAWFYCFNNGVMARNIWIDGYWVNDSGVWVH